MVRQLTGRNDLDQSLIKSTLAGIPYDFGKDVPVGYYVKGLLLTKKIIDINYFDKYDPNYNVDAVFLAYVRAINTLKVEAATMTACVGIGGALAVVTGGLSVPACLLGNIVISPIKEAFLKQDEYAIIKQWRAYFDAREHNGCSHDDILNGNGLNDGYRSCGAFFYKVVDNTTGKVKASWIYTTARYPDLIGPLPNNIWYPQVFEIAESMYEFQKAYGRGDYDTFKNSVATKLNKILLNPVCTVQSDPIEIVPGTFSPYSGKSCAGTFQLYKFPVIADGREYRITIKPISGNPDLYASRYPEYVDTLEELQNWNTVCPAWEDFCLASITPGLENEIVSFIAPTGEPSYYSWFAVYGSGSEESQYVVDISYNNPWKMSPVWTGNQEGAQDYAGRYWYEVDFDDSNWLTVKFPYIDENDVGNNDRFFRTEFELTSQELIWMKGLNIPIRFASNDGIWIYINGRPFGHWGSDWRGAGCVNDFLFSDYFLSSCNQNIEVSPQDIKNFLFSGRNVIAVLVTNGFPGTFLNVQLSEQSTKKALQSVPVKYIPKVVENGFINQGQTKSFSLTNMVQHAWALVLNWGGSQMKLTIYRPDGSLYGEFLSDRPPPIHVSIPDAEAGTWRIDVTAVDVPFDNYAYSFIASSPFDMNQDSETDGIPDYWEEFFGSDKYVNDAFLDYDSDSLTNKQEFDLRINPIDPDTDQDNLNDNDEINIGTNPTNPDTDGDGVSDGQEVYSGYNPTDPASKPSSSWVAHYMDSDIVNATAADSEGNIYVTGASGGDYATIKYSTDGIQLWVAHYNGSDNKNDQALAIAIDASGNVYVTGQSDGSGTSNDIATIKYDTNGNQMWVRRYNGPGNGGDYGSAIAVDSIGNVYITGNSWGSGTLSDIVTIKYDTNGNQLWMAKYATNGGDSAIDIAIDMAGNVYVTGDSSIYPTTGSNIVTIKYDSNGNQLWVTRGNGPVDADHVTALAIDAGGNVYVTGCSQSGGYYYTDYATIKYDANGNQLWVARYDGPGTVEIAGEDDDCSTAIALDNSGNVLVTGYSSSITSWGSQRKDYATIKYSPNGEVLWVSRYNKIIEPRGYFGNEVIDLVVDASGNVYVTGTTASKDYLWDSVWSYTTIKYNPNGKLIWVTNYDFPTGYSVMNNPKITLDSMGNLFVSGSGWGSYNNFDYFLIKYGTLDSDGDGIPDSVENGGGSDFLNPYSTPEVCDGKDNNQNGLADEGYDNYDSDGDGVKDCLDEDNDNDGLPDYIETNSRLFVNSKNTGTDPLNPDSDSDGIFDGYEVANAMNPLVANDQNFSDVDGDEWTDWQEFLSGTGASDASSVPQVTRSVVYRWDSQAEFDLWHWWWGGPPGISQWVESGGPDGSGYLHIESRPWKGFEISESHSSWFLSEVAWVDVRNAGPSPLQVYIYSGAGWINKQFENGWYNENTGQWSDLVPADGQWHRLQIGNSLTNMAIGSGYTGISFWTEDGSAVSVDVDNLTNDCQYCSPMDNDRDGLSNTREGQLGTDANNPDSDFDGIFDGYEVSNGLNPLVRNDQNFSDTDGDEWTDWQEFRAGTGANDAGSMPSSIAPVQYRWDSQAEVDLWVVGDEPYAGTAQWLSSGGPDGSGYMHLEDYVPSWGPYRRILEAHPSWFMSQGATVYARNSGNSPLHINLIVRDNQKGLHARLENGWYDSYSDMWFDLLPPDGQWHEVRLQGGVYTLWRPQELTRTSLVFWTDDGSAVSVDVDNLTNDCFYCHPLLGDTDNDGIVNLTDNAPAIYNPDQRDTDGDGVGDVADAYPADPARSQTDTASPPTDGSANIGSGGGSFTTADGTLDVQVSAGAVVTDMTVTVAKDTYGQGGLVVQTNSGQGELLAAYDFIPSGLTFAEPVTIVFHYSDLIDETNLGVYWYNPETGFYEQVVPYVQDTVANTLTVQVSHFSVYALIRLLDAIPPTIEVIINPLPNAAGWHNADVTVTFTCSDAESGIATCPVLSIVSTEGAGQVITGTAIDKVGNAASTSVTINLDKTPPALFCPLNVTVQATEPTGISATDLSLQSFFIGAMADDNIDTMVSVYNNAPNFLLIGVTPVTFTAADYAGNLSTCQAVVTVGNPPPVFDLIPGQAVDEGQPLIFVVSATDPNHNDLTYEASVLPSGATFDVTSSTFSYTPEYDVSTRLADSFFDVFFTVTDGTTPVSQTVHITVRNVNRSPAASAGIDQQLECAGASCPIILDGSGSTDPDSSPGTQDDIAGFRWYEGYGTSAQQLLGTGKIISATLSLGNHAVTLEVTDQSGAVGTDTLTITLDPARLSMFVLEKAEIDWPKNAGEIAYVKLHGRMALPVGLLQQELIPTELISLDLAGQSGVFAQTVNFEVKGGEGEKWEYKATPTGAGIQNLSIHWKGAKFDYKGTVRLKSEFIGLTETALSLDREGVTEPITFSVNGVTAVIDGTGIVMASVPYESDEDGEVTLTLPFELKPEMKITLTIGNQAPVIIGVGDYYTPGGGKFELRAKIDPRGLTGASRPATLRMNVALGIEGFHGSAGVSEGEWNKLSTKEWKAELK